MTVQNGEEPELSMFPTRVVFIPTAPDLEDKKEGRGEGRGRIFLEKILTLPAKLEELHNS